MTTEDTPESNWPAPDWADHIAPEADDIERIARETVATLPPQFRAAATHVVLHVADFADEVILDELGIEDPFDLTGLYDGVPLTERSVSDPPRGPDVIWLFRRPILDEWVGRGDVTLSDLVSHVMVHELAHHFGWSDDDIAAIDRWWE